MWAARMRHAQGVQPGQDGERDDVCTVLKQMRIKPGLADQRIGIDAEIAQGRRDLPAVTPRWM